MIQLLQYNQSLPESNTILKIRFFQNVLLIKAPKKVSPGKHLESADHFKQKPRRFDALSFLILWISKVKIYPESRTSLKCSDVCSWAMSKFPWKKNWKFHGQSNKKMD